MNKNRQIIGELQVYLYTIGQVDHSVSVLFNKECRSLCQQRSRAIVQLQEGYFLSLHEQWPNIDGSIQLEAGKNSDINPGFTKKQKIAQYTQPRNKDERGNVRKGGTS